MKISTRSQYGLRAMAFLAQRKDFVSVAEVAKKEKIPLDYLGKIFLKLKKANLVKVKRGAKGGYFLAQAPAKITIAEIIQALGDWKPLVPCVDESKKNFCLQKKKCLVKNIWFKLKKNWDSLLNSLTLAEVVKQNG